MEIRQLRYFVAVAEELHFTRAAEKLNISPPSLTQQIQVLERGLGVRLLTRTKRSVALTDAGIQLLDEARIILRQVERAETMGRLAGRGEIGRIEIGYVTSASCAGLIPSVVAAYGRSHPLVELHLHRQETPDQLRDISIGRLDVGFLRPPVKYPVGLTGYTILKQPLIVALPAGHRLAAIRSISVRSLRDETFITPTVEVELGFPSYIDTISTAGNFQPRIVRRTPDILSIVTLVGAGLGVAILPGSFRHIQIPGVTYRSLSQGGHASIAVSFRKDEKSPAVKAFIAQLRGRRKLLQ